MSVLHTHFLVSALPNMMSDIPLKFVSELQSYVQIYQNFIQEAVSQVTNTTMKCVGNMFELFVNATNISTSLMNDAHTNQTSTGNNKSMEAFQSFNMSEKLLYESEKLLSDSEKLLYEFMNQLHTMMTMFNA